MKLAASIIEYLVSLIIFILFFKLGYWITGVNADIGVMCIFYLILTFGSAIGNGVGAGIYASIMRGEKK